MGKMLFVYGMGENVGGENVIRGNVRGNCQWGKYR